MLYPRWERGRLARIKERAGETPALPEARSHEPAGRFAMRGYVSRGLGTQPDR